MIDGEWGSGKTYFLKHSLLKIMESADYGKDKRRKYAYVSLYGVKSIDNITKSILFQYWGKKYEKSIESVNCLIDTASNMLSLATDSVNINLSNLNKNLRNIAIKEWIICFDDLERCFIPLNEILGYINQLVEHNKCKVIIIANEKEIGKLYLNQNLEAKYQVVLSGQKIDFDPSDKTNDNDQDKGIGINRLYENVKKLFEENIEYRTIREKVIGLTIKYEVQISQSYDSILKGMKYNDELNAFFAGKKDVILQHFENQGCCNLRTLISIFSCVEKIYDEMIDKNFNSVECYYDEIMDLFLEYVVLVMIYYKNGGKVSDLGLNTESGYVHLKKNFYDRTRGFKFLERYCTTLNFSTDEFTRVVSKLRREFEDKKQKENDQKIGLGQAYGDLTTWWELEDEQVQCLIKKLGEEVRDDKYPIVSYQGIIGQLMVLEENGFTDVNMDSLIDCMNKNISKTNGKIDDIDRFSYSFTNEVLHNRYLEYVDKIKCNVDAVNNSVKSSEITDILNDEAWENNITKYCDEHYNDFILRYGFIDLIDTDILLDKLLKAKVQEWYTIKSMLQSVYRAANIKDFFLNDKVKLEKMLDKIREIEVSGINKPLAKKLLMEYIEDILKRLN